MLQDHWIYTKCSVQKDQYKDIKINHKGKKKKGDAKIYRKNEKK
jgi:hypothetical protein